MVFNLTVYVKNVIFFFHEQKKKPAAKSDF